MTIENTRATEDSLHGSRPGLTDEPDRGGAKAQAGAMSFPARLVPLGLALFCLRMRFVVHGQQVGQCDLGVFLGCRELGVAEEFLDGAEVGAVA